MKHIFYYYLTALLNMYTDFFLLCLTKIQQQFFSSIFSIEPSNNLKSKYFYLNHKKKKNKMYQNTETIWIFGLSADGKKYISIQLNALEIIYLIFLKY